MKFIPVKEENKPRNFRSYYEFNSSDYLDLTLEALRESTLESKVNYIFSEFDILILDELVKEFHINLRSKIISEVELIFNNHYDYRYSDTMDLITGKKELLNTLLYEYNSTIPFNFQIVGIKSFVSFKKLLGEINLTSLNRIKILLDQIVISIS